MLNVMNDETARNADRIEAAKWLADRGLVQLAGRRWKAMQIAGVRHSRARVRRRYATSPVPPTFPQIEYPLVRALDREDP